MGVVYAAEDERLRRTVALKALPPEYTRDPVRRERLTREARAAAALSHPAIATIFALEEIDGELYIISELVRGRTLREELRDGPLPAGPAAPGPARHRRGPRRRARARHRPPRSEAGEHHPEHRRPDQGAGLRPGAQRRRRARRPTATRLTEAGSALGTPGYMAPEQLNGGEVDVRTDVFAFGVLAWELATGEHPFGNDAAAVLARMTELMEGRPSGLSRPLPLPGLDRIVRRCLRAAPADRYPSSAALLADLRALASAGEPRAGAAGGCALVVAVSPAGDRSVERDDARGRVGDPQRGLDRPAVRLGALPDDADARDDLGGAASQSLVHVARASRTRSSTIAPASFPPSSPPTR